MASKINKILEKIIHILIIGVVIFGGILFSYIIIFPPETDSYSDNLGNSDSWLTDKGKEQFTEIIDMSFISSIISCFVFASYIFIEPKFRVQKE